MHVRQIGSGPTIMIIHGCPSTWEAVWPLAECLADDYRVLVPDLPGYGESQRVEPYDVASVRAALVELLGERGVDSVRLIGHSNGVYRALDLAIHADVDVDAIASLAGLAHFPEPMHDTFREFAAALRSGADLSEAAVAQWTSPTHLAEDPDFADRIRALWNSMDPDTVADDLEASCDFDDLRPHLADITAPVYLRVGAEDAATPPAWSQEMAELLPNAQLDIVDGAGHFAHLEDTDGACGALRRFLDA